MAIYLRHALAVIFDLQGYRALGRRDLDARGVAARVTQHIGERLLRHPEQCELAVAVQPLEVRRHLEHHIDATAFAETIHEPAQRAGEPKLVE